MEKSLRFVILLMLACLAVARKGGNCNNRKLDSPKDKNRDQKSEQPNIVYIMADDLGWNDVGFHNPKVKTPHIDKLKRDGIELTQSYMQPVCSASRSAFLTGKYPSNNGLQLLVIQQEAPTCLPLEHKTIFQYMKDEGYVTAQVGKWHLGYCHPKCLPESRGADQFIGVRTGAVDYFNWTDHDILQRTVDGQPNDDGVGTHLTVQDAIDIRGVITNHSASESKPLFLWLTPTAPHDPLQNGGANQAAEFGHHTYYANNYPLRNGKATYTEGGIRIPTLYFDPRLHRRTRGTTRDFLVHVTDWLPTFVQLGSKSNRGRRYQISGLDGVSQVANLGSTYSCPKQRKYYLREEFLVALSDATQDVFTPSDCATEDSAFRWKDFKLIYGEQYYGRDPATLENEWPKPEESPELKNITGDDCHRIVDGQRVVRCLFNVIDDPSETVNLFDEKPKMVERLLEKIEAAKKDSVKPVYIPSLGTNDTTVETWGSYLVPKHDYCTPTVQFPLVSNDPSCY
ncbi:arylsulfatase J-like [Watersipora subatra]|uniref:arylsulfatase J-like n=1 Tax=Watersipora subatra TaxID=2589382 RepID=UPI00355C1EC2